MVERHPVRDPSTSVVTRDGEVPEAQLLHDLHQVASHGPLGVGGVVRRRGRTIAPSVAAEIGADDGKRFGQPRRDFAPHEMRLGKAVQQEDRRAGAVGADEDPGFRRPDVGGGEVIERHAL